MSGGVSNSAECALRLPSELELRGPGLVSARWMRMCRGKDGGCEGGSVVGLGGSTMVRGGDGGMWVGTGESAGTAGARGLWSSEWGKAAGLGEELLGGSSM